MAARKKTTRKTGKKKAKKASKPKLRKPRPKSPPVGLTLSIDMKALEKLYKRRYDIKLDGDTKGGLGVSLRDGDTKGAYNVIFRDGDTK